MRAQHGRMAWQVKLRRGPLADVNRDLYGSIAASYGGTLSERGAKFRRYRAAEACANSVWNELGLETDVELMDEEEPLVTDH